MTKCSALLAMVLVISLPGGAAFAADPVAVLSEIRPGRGEVRVKPAGKAEWQAPQPLLALRPGDQVRADGDARAVVVFTGGRGTQTVTQASSPFTVQAPAVAGSGERARVLVGSVTSFLMGQQKDTAFRSLSVRSLRQPPVILAPRATRVLPGPVAFEWRGAERARYTVRVIGPQGLLWQQPDLPRVPLAYPPAAPPLRPGTRYTWELETPDQPVQRAEFEVLGEADAARVREAAALLAPSALAGYPANTATLVRAGFLYQQGLYAEARRELLAGIAADADEPGFHQLLGFVYDRIGLQNLAAEAFDEAAYLAGQRP